PPNATVDQLAMGLGPRTAETLAFQHDANDAKVSGTSARTELAPYAPATGLSRQAAAWSAGPVQAAAQLPSHVATASACNFGVLPLAHTGDQLRKVVPDGREDISLAAMFEIGRLLALSKPTLVAALMDWRRELFGAARARELTELLAGGLFDGFAVAAVGGRN